MKKRFLAIISLLYVAIIIHAWLSGSLKNFLAPNMQIYLKLSVIPLLLIGLTLLFNNNINYKFKISDLILLLPLLLLFIAGDGKLTMTFANNRIANFNSEKKVKNEVKKVKEDLDEEDTSDAVTTNDENSKEDFDFDIIDANYNELANYITYINPSDKFVDKTIRVKGFTTNNTAYVPDNYFVIGKYAISCCAADANFVGFIVKHDRYKIKNNTWYELEGVLEKTKDKSGYDIMTIRISNLKEIDSKEEEQYVYPCYAYDDGKCEAVTKYNLEY